MEHQNHIQKLLRLVCGLVAREFDEADSCAPHVRADAADHLAPYQIARAHYQ